jgi:hypothetical protein
MLCYEFQQRSIHTAATGQGDGADRAGVQLLQVASQSSGSTQLHASSRDALRSTAGGASEDGRPAVGGAGAGSGCAGGPAREQHLVRTSRASLTMLTNMTALYPHACQGCKQR